MLESKSIIPLQVSKWVKIPFLIDGEEMEALVRELPPFKIYDVQGLSTKETGIYDPEHFVQHYANYINYLKKGESPPLQEFRPLFSGAWSLSESALYSLPTQGERRLLKAFQPVIQSQMNQIRYDQEENIFRDQVFGESISWGIQLGFPHLFMDPQTCAALKTRDFPNMALFLGIQRWIRAQTVPTPFIVKDTKINSPIRLGKRCFSWIGQHPQLKALGFRIAGRI